MKPLKLVMSGWGPYAEVEEVDFTKFKGDGLFLITGPTGAGKTTIFDAVSFALYGNVSGKVREKSSVRSDFAKPSTDTFVTLDFTHKGVNYRIIRSPKYERPKKRGEGFTTSLETAELYEEDLPPIASVSDVNKKLDEIMGISYSQFKQIAMIAQGEFLELLLAGSKDRVDIFRNLFKTDQYDQLQKNLSEKTKILENQIVHLKHKLEEDIKMMEVHEDGQLQELLEVEYPNYDKVYQEAKRYIEKRKQEHVILKKQIIELEEKAKERIGKITEGENRNNRIQLLSLCKQELLDLEKRKQEVVTYEERIRIADIAEKVAGEEKVYLKIATDILRIKEKTKDLEKGIQELEPKFEESQKKLLGNQELREKLVQNQERMGIIESNLPLLEELEGAKIQQKEKEKRLVQLGKQREEIAQSIQLAEQEKQTNLVEIEKYEKGSSDIGILNLEIQKEERRKLDLEKVWRQLEKYSQDEIILSKLQTQYEEASEKKKAQRSLFERLEEVYERAAAGLLAKTLEDNHPCPVCGSLLHPRIATVPENVPDETQLKKCKEEAQKADKYAEEIFHKTAVQKALLDSEKEELVSVLGSLGMESKDQLLPVLRVEKEYKEMQSILDNLAIKKEELEQKQIRKAELLQKNIQLVEKLGVLYQEKEDSLQLYQHIKSEHDILRGTMEGIRRKVVDDGDVRNLKEEHQRIAEESQNLENIITAVEKQHELMKSNLEHDKIVFKKEQEELHRLQLEEEQERNSFIIRIKELGFANIEAYRQAFLLEEKYQSYVEQVKQYHQQVQGKIEQIRNLEEETKDKSAIDLSQLKAELEETEEKKTQLQLEKEEIGTEITINKKSVTSIKGTLIEKEKLDKEYGVLKDLDNVTKGNNLDRVVFEHYVLGAYFEDVLSAANVRLLDMTGGRYELLKVKKVVDARTKDSLDLEVLDNYTGKRRSVKTLSGGESFKAALSMALGLSDMIQNNAGGIHIDTLFIDEGFGSLDEESLNQALNTLMKLSEKNRLIGIVSHVAELKERIPNQILVDKNSCGSGIITKD